ncbi:TetR/AcrR family transcriptional regulator [Secundilactobacillus hailunensis]|uniref:TetR/AcrR family transcriptional regulator n=1 Tax=Secundilactobacillus hailunensis TaxID=2559923 RepID=A0ABW1T7R3_9LACO|nr:TetR family transcriptional regulator [Secundilactobacillus hailunensis]
MNEADFNQVTVGKIAQSAMINRQTFYYHYQDKYDLTEKMIAEFAADYDQVFYQKMIQGQSKKTDLTSRIAVLFPQVNSFWADNRERIAALFSIQFNHHSLQNELKKRFETYLLGSLQREPLPLEKRIYPAIIITVIEYIVDTGKIPTQAELTETFAKLANVFE